MQQDRDIGKYARTWMRLGSVLENQNEAVIWSFFVAALLVPLPQLLFVEELCKAWFGWESVNAYFFSTWVFAVTLGATLYLRARGRRSKRVLRRKHRALRRLQKEKVISTTKEREMHDLLVSDYQRALRGQSPSFEVDGCADVHSSNSAQPDPKRKT